MNRDNIFIAAVGASAGGLKAVEDLIEVLEPNDDMAYVIIQHLSSDHQSYMDEILIRKKMRDFICQKWAPYRTKQNLLKSTKKNFKNL